MRFAVSTSVEHVEDSLNSARFERAKRRRVDADTAQAVRMAQDRHDAPDASGASRQVSYDAELMALTDAQHQRRRQGAQIAAAFTRLNLKRTTAGFNPSEKARLGVKLLHALETGKIEIETSAARARVLQHAARLTVNPAVPRKVRETLHDAVQRLDPRAFVTGKVAGDVLRLNVLLDAVSAVESASSRAGGVAASPPEMAAHALPARAARNVTPCEASVEEATLATGQFLNTTNIGLSDGSAFHPYIRNSASPDTAISQPPQVPAPQIQKPATFLSTRQILMNPNASYTEQLKHISQYADALFTAQGIAKPKELMEFFRLSGLALERAAIASPGSAATIDSCKNLYSEALERLEQAHQLFPELCCEADRGRLTVSCAALLKHTTGASDPKLRAADVLLRRVAASRAALTTEKARQIVADVHEACMTALDAPAHTPMVASFVGPRLAVRALNSTEIFSSRLGAQVGTSLLELAARISALPGISQHDAFVLLDQTLQTNRRARYILPAMIERDLQTRFVDLRMSIGTEPGITAKLRARLATLRDA